MEPIHLCYRSGQPDIHIKCDNSWTTPASGFDEPRVRLPAGVYLSNDRRLFTFDAGKASCPACKAV